MTWPRVWLSRLRGLVQRRRFDEDLRDEIRGHLDEATDEFIRHGLSPADARRAAHHRFGGVARIEEVHRDARGGRLDALWKDLVYGARALRRHPGLASIGIVSLALGLGANAATFGMMDRLMLRPFTIRDVGGLVLVAENTPGNTAQRRDTVAAANFREWPAAATSLDRFTAFSSWSANLADDGQPERIDGQRVSAGFFPLLGVTPALGRLLQPADEVWGQHHRVVISTSLWHRRFAADPNVVGQTVRLDGEPYTIVGVAPPAFEFPVGSEIWVPLALAPAEAADRSTRFLSVIAALRPHATIALARAEMQAIYAREQRTDPGVLRGREVFVYGFTEGLTDPGMPSVFALQQLAALFVLLIVCTNVASLLLARDAERQRELALRLALGASRGRLVRQLLVENLVLAMAAVPLALAVTWGVIRGLDAAMPAQLLRYIPGWDEMGVDVRVVGFTIAASAITSVVFGTLPAFNVSRLSLTGTLKDGGRSVTAGRSRSRFRRGLAVAAVALALPLLVTSGMVAIAAQRFATGPQGFDPDGVLQLRLALPPATYADDGARRRFADRLVAAAGAVPGVTRAAVATVIPSSMTNQERRISIDGVADDPDTPRVANYRAMSPEYLDALRIPVRAGRAFTAGDRDGAQLVSIVSESFVRRYLAPGQALGRRVRLGGPDAPWTTVVGVSADTIDDWFLSRGTPTVFVPFAQFPGDGMTLVARTSGDPAQLAGGLRSALGAVDATQPAFDVMTLREAVRVRTTGLRVIAGVMAAFGALALVLSALGIYGIMAHFVAQRRHEFGVRMALGASARQLLSLTVGQGARLTAIGIAIGLAAAIGLARLIESALYGIVAIEWPLIASIAALLAFASLLAAVLPARRAMRLDPAVVLRE